MSMPTAEAVSDRVTHTSITTGRPGKNASNSPRWGSLWQLGESWRAWEHWLCGCTWWMCAYGCCRCCGVGFTCDAVRAAEVCAVAYRQKCVRLTGLPVVCCVLGETTLRSRRVPGLIRIHVNCTAVLQSLLVISRKSYVFCAPATPPSAFAFPPGSPTRRGRFECGPAVRLPPRCCLRLILFHTCPPLLVVLCTVVHGRLCLA